MSLTKLTAIVAASIFAACANAQFSTVDRNWHHTTSATAGATVSSTNSGSALEDFIGSFKALPGTQGDAFANSDIKYINGPGSHTLAVDNNTAFGPHTANVSATSNAEATWIFNLATQSQWTFSGTFTKVGNGTGSVELDFGTGIRSGRDTIIGQKRGVDYSSHPLAGITAADGNVTINQADTCHAALQVIWLLRSYRDERS